MKQKWFVLALGLIAMLITGSAFAQTTGAIEGTVVDSEGGQPLPGVQVTISSPKLQGTKTAFTDANGAFRFREIPPGDYKVAATLTGFGSVTREDVRVGLDRTADVRMRLTAAISESVTVTGEAPLVDIKSSTMGQNMTEEVLQALPLGRNFTAALRTVPSAHADETGFSINGATGAENNYIVDGVETTEIERGRNGKTINMEFVQEVEAKTGGYEAEFGRAIGGVINVITKSGGNEFHGDVFAYYEDDSLTDDFDGKDASESQAASTQAAFTRKDYGIDVGGYVMKDTLWFFAAYDLVRQETDSLISEDLQHSFPELDESYRLTRDQDLRSAKLTWNITSNHNLVFSLFGDPGERKGALGVISGEESTFMATNESGGDDYTLKYLGVLTPSLFLNLQGSRHVESSKTIPDNDSEVLVLDRTGASGVIELRSGGYGGHRTNEFQRDTYKGDFTYFLDGAGGSHELKLGVDQQKVTADNNVSYTGGQLLWVFNCGTRPCDPALGNIYYGHEYYVAKGTTLANVADGWLPGGIDDSPETKNFSVFLQDSWRIGQNFTMNIGLRWEKQTIAGGDGLEWIKLDDNYAPRLGFVWDPSGAGTQKVSAFYGRFFENIPLDINIRFMGAEADAYIYNQDPNSLEPSAVRAGRIRGAISTLQSIWDAYGVYPVDPDLKGGSSDQWKLGYEMQFAKNWSLSANLIYNSLNRVIEDGGATIIDENGDPAFIYVVGNPGEGTMRTAPNLAYTDAFTIDKPKRTYKALQLSAQRRMSDNWGMFASYVYSKLEGTYDGSYQRSTGQLDPNINSAYDYYDFSVVWTADCVMDGTCKKLDGPLSNDRTHQFKIDAYYTAKMGPGSLTASFSPYWMSGRPITVQGWSDVYRNNELALTKRGAYGTMDDEYEIDLGLGYSMPIGPVSILAKVDVFNVLDRQGITDVDQLWATTEDGNGTYHDGADASEAPNDGFGDPVAWQNPRNYRLTLKFSF